MTPPGLWEADMNFKLVFNITGRVLMLLGAAMLPSLAVALLYNESGTPFLYSILSMIIVI